ncbi:MAG: MerR family transcriptional regulator, partial [Thiomonas sp.]
MNDRSANSALLLGIAAVERDTGIGKDTLRVWERRYGFPRPQRDAAGDRLYPLDQVEQLRLIKRLLDCGHRPAQIVGLPIDRLDALSRQCEPAANSPSVPGEQSAAAPPDDADIQAYLDVLRQH